MTTTGDRTAAAGDDAADGWFFTRNGEQIGPRSRAELKAYLAIIPIDGGHVWHPSLTSWVPVEQSVFNPIPAVQPPPIMPPPVLPSPLLGPFGYSEPAEAPPGFWSMLFSFRGRAGRRRYFLYTVLVAAVGVSLMMAVLGAEHLTMTGADAVAIRLVIGVPFFWIYLALTSKRLHDLGLSAWHLLWVAPVDYLPNIAPNGLAQLVLSIPGLPITIWLLFKRGQVGVNAFGPDPLGSKSQIPVGSTTFDAPKKHPVRNGVLIALGAVVVIGVAAIGLAGIEDAAVPACASKEVTDKVRQITASNPVFAIMVGAYHDNFSIDDPRTLSDSEPMNGRTCVATLAVRDGENRASVISSQQITYTVQNVDGQGGRYVVSLEQ